MCKQPTFPPLWSALVTHRSGAGAGGAAGGGAAAPGAAAAARHAAAVRRAADGGTVAQGGGVTEGGASPVGGQGAPMATSKKLSLQWGELHPFFAPLCTFRFLLQSGQKLWWAIFLIKFQNFAILRKYFLTGVGFLAFGISFMNQEGGPWYPLHEPGGQKHVA